MSAAARLAARRAAAGDVDQRFAEYVNGKTIAVVGPAPADGDQADAVEGHDIVYRVSGQWGFGDDYGPRADIVFTNSGISSQVRDGMYWDRFEQLGVRWVVTKRNIGLEHRNVRHARKPPGANPLQVVMAVYDLAQFDPASVTVFGADFYMAGPKRMYQPEYLAHCVGMGLGAARSSVEREHRIEQQVKPIRSVIAAKGWPTGDRRFLDVVNLDEQELIRRWREVWYDPALEGWVA